jgi:hypothetical protein
LKVPRWNKEKEADELISLFLSLRGPPKIQQYFTACMRFRVFPLTAFALEKTVKFWRWSKKPAFRV